MENQNPEQKARDLIDKKLVETGWVVQSKDGIGLNAALGVAIREYSGDTGPMAYMLMVDGKPCGVIEAKKAEEAHKLSTVEDQANEYSTSKLKFFRKLDLRMIRDHVSSSFHVSQGDMEYAPLDTIGGPFRFRKLFGDRADVLLEELNEALAA